MPMRELSVVQRRSVHYRGNVQRVGFRYTTQRVAAGFRVDGYVKNLPDGRVEVVVEGEADEVDRFLTAVLARLGHFVDDSTVETLPAENRFRGFEIRF